MHNSVIFTAAGRGSRMQSEIPKQFLLLNDKPILMQTMQLFYAYDSNLEMLVVLNKEYFVYWKSLCEKHNFSIPHRVVEGGEERFYSVQNAIAYLTGELVAIHDAVRPLATIEMISKCFQSAQIYKNAIPVLPINQSIRKKMKTGSQCVDRSAYFLVQTPQVFHRKTLIEGYSQQFNKNFTDDASVVERLGEQIYLVDGNEENIKITTPHDLNIAHFLFHKNRQ